MLENEIVDYAKKALNEFIETTGLGVRIMRDLKKDQRQKDIEIEIQHDDYKFIFDVVVKRRINETLFGILVNKLDQKWNKVLIITEYVTPVMADKMKKLGIQYLDTVGNMYIKELPLYIEITGRKFQDRKERRKGQRIFYPAGLKVTFALLCLHGIEKKTYREIAEITGTAHGTVAWTFKDLMKAGYMTKVGNVRQLINKKELLKRWIEAYHERLRPKQIQGRYKANNFEWRKGTDIKKYEALWGGEVGAAILEKYLIPEKVTIYTKGKAVNKLILKGGFRKEVNGDIEILKQFWNFESKSGEKSIVPALLIYADLIGTGENRNIETARMIYDKEIERYLR